MALHDLSARLQHWQRSHELSSDARTGTYARSTARSKQVAQLRGRWVAHLITTLVSCAFVWLLSLTLPTPYPQGLAVRVGFTAVVAVQWVWIIEATGTAYLAMGEQAEQFTASLLRKRRGWRVVNHVNLRQSDIDHVLFGPDGIFAIETKWSSQAWTPERLTGAAGQAARNARDLTLWSNLRPFGPVHPLVVVWGPTATELPANTTINDVPVIPGKHFDQWWQQRPIRPTALSPADLDTAWDALSQRCEVMDPNQPVKPLAFSDIAVMGSLAVAVGMLALVTVVQAMSNLPLIAGLGVVAACIALGVVVRLWLRNPQRWLATAWLTGIGSAFAFAAVAIVTG